MHGRRSQLHNLESTDLELEKTLPTHKHVAIKDKIKMDLQQPAPQERPFKDHFSPLANLSTSCISVGRFLYAIIINANVQVYTKSNKVMSIQDRLHMD